MSKPINKINALKQAQMKPITPYPPNQSTPQSSIQWQKSLEPVPYQTALQWMENYVNQITQLKKNQPNLIWLLEHPALYTAGRSAKSDELLLPQKFPVIETNRGGRLTYHGPGQRVIYLIIDLNRRKEQNLHGFIKKIEQWIIETLAHYGVKAQRHPDHIGIWVETDKGCFDKIAAIGIRLRRWVSFHGCAVNINPDLSHFNGIIACGVREKNLGVTSLKELGVTITSEEFDRTLQKHCPF